MRILVVEDEKKIAQALKKGLEMESYAVDVAYEGQTGLDLALTEDYDLILLDIMLPDLDGLAVTRQLRAQSIQSPILFLTAKGQLQDKVTGLDLGADDYLTKPFSFEELLARVRALLRRPASTLPSVLTADNLTLDTTRFEVKRDGTLLQLTNKEFALLEFLLRRGKSVANKEQIIQHVWNYDADVLPNTVEVYIGYLRNKVDKAFPHLPPLIETVRGFGYRIAAEKDG